MSNENIVLPHLLLVKEADLKLSIIGIDRKIKDIEEIKTKLKNKVYLDTHCVKKTIDVKDFLDNLVTIESVDVKTSTKNKDNTYDFKTIIEVKPNSYKPGDTIKFYVLNKEYGYLQPTGYEFKFKKNLFKEYDLSVEEELERYRSVCNYFVSLKCKLLYDYCQTVYFTVNDNKNTVTKLVIKQ